MEMRLDGYVFEDIQSIQIELESRTTHRPKVAIVLADGLENLTSVIQNQETISYADIPNFPTRKNHESHLIFGTVGGKATVCSKGNVCQIEGFPAWQVGLPVRVMSFMGAEMLITVNKVRSLNDKFKAGDIVLLLDHVNLPALAGDNPMLGINDSRFGSRFADLTAVYDKGLRRLCYGIAQEIGIDSFMKEGIYVQESGPSFESSSEFAFLKMIGADVLGMDILPEVVMAKSCGMRVCAISLVTGGKESGHPSNLIQNHNEAAEDVFLRRQEDLASLLSRLVARMDEEQT